MSQTKKLKLEKTEEEISNNSNSNSSSSSSTEIEFPVITFPVDSHYKGFACISQKQSITLFTWNPSTISDYVDDNGNSDDDKQADIKKRLIEFLYSNLDEDSRSSQYLWDFFRLCLSKSSLNGFPNQYGFKRNFKLNKTILPIVMNNLERWIPKDILNLPYFGEWDVNYDICYFDNSKYNLEISFFVDDDDDDNND